MIASLDPWTANDAFYYYLGDGFPIERNDPDIGRFEFAAVANCRAHALPSELAACLDYQKLLSASVPWNYPVSSAFGRLLVGVDGADDLLRRVVWIGAVATVSIFLAAATIFVAALWRLDSVGRSAGAASVLALLATQILAWGRGAEYQFTLLGGSYCGLVALSGGIACLLLLRKIVVDRLADNILQALTSFRGASSLFLLFVFLIIGRAVEETQFGAEIVALLVAAALFGVVSKAARIPCTAALGCALVLFCSLQPGFRLQLEFPRFCASLTIGALLGAATLRPGTRVVWLMPTALGFHVSSAGLTAGVVAIAEAIVCLRRGRVSHLLGASLLAAFGGVVYNLTLTGGGALSASGTDVTEALRLVAEAQTLGPTLLTLGLLSMVTVLLLAGRHETWDGVARLALLSAAVVAALQTSSALAPSMPSVFNEQLFAFVWAVGHFSPAVAVAALVGVGGLLAHRIAASRPAARRTLPAWLLPVGVPVFLAIAQLPQIPFGPRAALNGPAVLFGAAPLNLAMVAPAAGHDDRYYLSATRPRDHPINFYSLLKMKIRKAQGSFDADAMQIYLVE